MVNSYGIFFSITANHLCSFTNTTPTTTTSTTALLHHSSSLKFHYKRSFGSSSSLLGPVTRNQAIQSDSYSSQTSELASIIWDNLGFDPISTDYMYTMKCSEEGGFSDGGLQPFQSIHLVPSACVLNYGQVSVMTADSVHDQAIIEDLKAYKKQDDSILLFRPEEYGLCMRIGADRLCMPAPTIEQFVEAVKVTVLANRRWIPPPDKGFLHIRPLLMGSGAVLSVKSAPEFTFLIYVTPVGNYFVEGRKPINLVVENEFHRATRGGVGNVKAISNYASILKAQAAAKANGFSDVLFLDSVHSRYLEEVSTANIFIVKDKAISTPVLGGTIQPSITRKSIIDIARSQGLQIEERLMSIEELFDADEVFCAGDSVCLLPVGSITYLDKRVSYKERGTSAVLQQLYLALTGIQMGLTEDKMGWTVVLK